MTDSTSPGAAVANVRAVRRAAAILKSFLERPSQSLAEVCAATGLDKGTTRRLILTLMDDGLLVLDAAGKRYRLGPIFRSFAANTTDDTDLRSLVGPRLSALTEEMQVTAFLSVWQHHHGAVCLDRFHGIRGLDFRWWAVGGIMPSNVGAASKLLLAYQSPAEIDLILAAPLGKMTEHTVTDPEELRATLRTIRAQGFALAVDDVAVGLAAVAVPVFGRGTSNEVVCALSLTGMTPQICVDDGRHYIERLRDIAARVTQTLP